MVDSPAISTAVLLFATTLATGRSLDAVTVQNNPQLTHNGVGVDADHDHGRRTGEYDYEVCPQVPSLHCRHGSTCTPGVAFFGKARDDLNLPTQESGYHCVCPSGYTGHECEIEVDYCDQHPTDPLDSCYHGAKCKSNGDRFFCDCKTANAESGSGDTKFAGPMCQHESTSMCAVSLVGSHAPNHQFCTNHGTCVRLVTSSEPHPGCNCAYGWTGDHCEIRRDPYAKVSREDESQGHYNWFAVVIPTVIVLGVFAAIFIDVKRHRTAAVPNKEEIFKLPKRNFGESDVDNRGNLPAPTERESGNDDKSVEVEVIKDMDDYLPETELV